MDASTARPAHKDSPAQLAVQDQRDMPVRLASPDIREDTETPAHQANLDHPAQVDSMDQLDCPEKRDAMRNTPLDVKDHADLVAQPDRRDHKATRDWMLDPERLDPRDQREDLAFPEHLDHRDHPERRAAMGAPVRMPNTAHARSDLRAALAAVQRAVLVAVVAVLAHTASVKHR